MAIFLETIEKDGQTLDSLMSTHKSPSVIADLYGFSQMTVFRHLKNDGWACSGRDNWYKVPRDVVIAVVRITKGKSDTALYLGTNEKYVAKCMEAEVINGA